ncbi:MAG: LytTR family transcriptional regulator DNA-binding domain-containing protein [Campylobacterales bacterium]|nr:LytTR family transcriptional regulator DNA-binding domain-containing protein [Campylobacterales bacterium]
MLEVQTALQTVKNRYKYVFNNQREMVCVFNKHFSITHINDAFCRCFAKHYDELIGRSFLDFVPKSQRVKVKHALIKVNQDEPSVTIMHQLSYGRTKPFWSEWTNHAVFDTDGKIVEYQSIGLDITTLKKALDKLEAIENPTKSANHSFMGKTDNGKKVIIKADEIFFIKANLVTVELFAESDKNAKVSMQIKEAESLLKSQNFFRVHRSYLVNLGKIKMLESIGESKYKIHFNGIESTILTSKKGARELRRHLKSKN